MLGSERMACTFCDIGHRVTVADILYSDDASH